MTDLHYLSLSDLCRRLKSGELSSVTVTEAILERITRLDPMLKAYVTVLADEALTTAAALDERRKNGQPLGTLHGVPIALKDLLWTEGITTTCGTQVLADWKPGEDATVVTKLKDAGAVVLGKVKLTEGAFSNHHPGVEPPVNPWAADRWTGVSSSGSGVSVASGMAYGALGTDTGGSIRFPSACCALVGIKPTYGRVSRHGAFPLAESLDHIGPMARTVEDAARMLQVIAGHDAKDPTSSDLPVPNYSAAMMERLEGLRVGVDWDYVGNGVEPAVVKVIEEALDVMKSLGAEVWNVTLPDCADLIDGWSVTCGVECALAHAETYPSRAAEYGPQLTGLLEIGRGATAMEYARLERDRERFGSELETVLGGAGAIIAPCMVTPPPTTDFAERVADDDAQVAAFIKFTAPFDYSGHPTITLPLGLDEDGVPRAFQLIGARFTEARLVGAASAFERAVAFTARPNLSG